MAATRGRRAVRIAGAAALALALMLNLATRGRIGGRAGAQETEPAPAADHESELLREADTIIADVAKVRGLEVKHKIKRGVMGRDRIRERVIELIDKEYTPEDLARDERMLKRLGLLPAADDFKKLYVDVATEQIAGFYDVFARELYIADWVGMEGAVGFGIDDGRMVMAHEIDHALQDQHFGLEKFMMTVAKTNDDAQAARQALIEGDGTALMMEYLFAQSGMDPPWGNPAIMGMIAGALESGDFAQGEKFAQAPLFLRMGLTFPYIDGLRFVVHFRKHHPWRRIDKIYRKPPLSTEHIFHPETYDRYERPDEITARPLRALGGYRIVHTNTWGELGLRVFLRQHGVAEATAEVAAAGWGGDRLVLLAPTADDGAVDSAVAVSYSTWDDEADAIECVAALRDALARWLGPADAAKAAVAVAPAVAAAVGDAEIAERTGPDGTVYAVERRGDEVVVLIGAPAAAATAARAEVWQRWQVKRR
jgi:hypothetical protein